MKRLLSYLFQPKKQQNIYDAIDQSMQFGYHSVNWSNVVWVS